MNDKERYSLYLCSREWSLLKEAVRRRCNGICERCNANPMEAVHHLTYARKYKERLDDLQAICNACHDFTHGKSNYDPAAFGVVCNAHNLDASKIECDIDHYQPDEYTHLISKPGAYHVVIEDCRQNENHSYRVEIGVLHGTRYDQSQHCASITILKDSASHSEFLSATSLSESDFDLQFADALIGQQIIVVFMLQKGALQCVNIAHIDDPRFAMVPKDEYAMKLLPERLRMYDGRPSRTYSVADL